MRASIIMAVALLSTTASAEVLYRGKVVRWTADRIIDEQHMPCVYGPWQSETLPNGSTVLTRSKVCVREEK